MIACRCSSANAPHAAISESVRPQPMHRPDAPSTMQTFLQGVEIVERSGMGPANAGQTRAQIANPELPFFNNVILTIDINIGSHRSDFGAPGCIRALQSQHP